MKAIPIVVVLAAATVASCAQREERTEADEAARLLQTDRDFSAASLQHGAAKAFLMYLDDDATMFSDGRHPVQGREAIYRIMTRGEEGYVLQWTPQAADVARSGEMGWTWGEYELATKAGDGEPSRSWGKYVNVWKKNNAGEWKVVADIGNESPPPGGTDEGKR